MQLSPFKKNIQKHFDSLSVDRRKWKGRNRYYYASQEKQLRFLVPAGCSVLELGCGTGELLNAVEPSVGIGVDISSQMIKIAREEYPHLTFIHADAEDHKTWNLEQTFDYIVISDTLGLLEDIQGTLEGLHPYCHTSTRIIITYYNFLWEPILKLGEKISLKMPQPIQNWLSLPDIENLLYLANFETVKQVRQMLVPKKIPLLCVLFEYLETLPLINRLCLCNYMVARPLENASHIEAASVSVIIPCKNEKGNIEPAVQRLKPLGKHTEIIFVDGHSRDGTPDEIKRIIERYPDRDIKFLIQERTGKGDAVRKGFAAAKGEILMILDADLTVAPEELDKFYHAAHTGKGEFINGCRLIYPMEKQAMRLLNIMGNKFFSTAFTWLLNQRIKDTLCGTKVLTKQNYEKIAANRQFFGDFDPFGDFDLLFGASKLNLKIVEIPIRYRSRTYGETQISRFKHGWLLLKMTAFAFFKLKVIK
ncbi:glycosyltransferase [Thermodesulfobacteriota bacterium]